MKTNIFLFSLVLCFGFRTVQSVEDDQYREILHEEWTRDMENEANNKDKSKKDNSKQSTLTKPCPRKLIEAFDLEGLDYPKQLDLYMCPKIKNTCCKVSDQLNMYNNWVKHKERYHLQSRLKYHRKVYFRMLNLSQDVYDRAKNVSYLLKHKESSNCKILSGKLVNYNIREIVPKLKDAIKRMHKFFRDSYKGFYCSICDADYTNFLQFDKKEFTFTDKFCRDIVVNTLPVLLYFHNHFTKYLSIAARFMKSCDVRGRYREMVIPNKYKLTTSKIIMDDLQKCKQNRNDKHWLAACLNICNKFEFTRYNAFFQPNLIKFESFADLMKIHIDKWEKQDEKYKQRMYNLLDKKTGKERKIVKKRILQEFNTLKFKNITYTLDMTAEVKKYTRPFRKSDIFLPNLGSEIEFEKILSVFGDKGMDPYDQGKQAVINNKAYKAVIKKVLSMNKIQALKKESEISQANLLETIEHDLINPELQGQFNDQQENVENQITLHSLHSDIETERSFITTTTFLFLSFTLLC